MIVNGFKSKAAALRYLKAQGHTMAGLLARPEANPKVAKNGKVDALTAPLHLAPFDLSGFQVCPQASAGCAAACLHTAGNPAYMAGKDASRKDKTQAYFKHRDAFMAVLTFEIAAHERKAAKAGMEAAVRLNATSDLPWERRKVNIDGCDVLLMEYFADVQFYDYTKVTKRALAFGAGKMPANYHLTFSKTEDNIADVVKVLDAGVNVAVVATPKRYKSSIQNRTIALRVPSSDGAAQVLRNAFCFDGDAHDYRPVEGMQGAVIALKAKGDAKHDTSGFVVS